MENSVQLSRTATGWVADLPELGMRCSGLTPIAALLFLETRIEMLATSTVGLEIPRRWTWRVCALRVAAAA